MALIILRDTIHQKIKLKNSNLFIKIMPKLKTNFTFEIEHKDTAIPEGIKASVQGSKGLIKLKFIDLLKISSTKSRFVFEIQHPKEVTPKQIANSMEGRTNCYSLKVLNYKTN